MVHHFAALVFAIDHHEPNKLPFYIGGGALAVWAVFLGFIGLRGDTFPASNGAARGVMGVSVLMVAIAITTALITS
jgi:hypothetical protein